MAWPSGGGSGGITPQDRAKLDNLGLPLKSNLSASAVPTAADDSTAGYSIGSTWIFSGTTYNCVDATAGSAVWVAFSDIFYFNDWPALVAAISVPGSTYISKYAQVSNANTGPSLVGTTYTAPGAVPSPVVDGNSSSYLVLAQGTNYSVKVQQRPPVAFRVTSIMKVAANKPTAQGFHIFSVTPLDGMPAGMNLNDILQLVGTTWTLYQSYAGADPSIVIGSVSNAVTMYRKVNGTWVDASIPVNAIRTVSGAVTTIPTDGEIRVNAASSAIDITMMEAIQITGQPVTIKKIDSSANAVNVTGRQFNFVAQSSGTTLTVTSISPSTILRVGQIIGTISGSTVITALGTGTGGVGTYTLSTSQTVSSGSQTSWEPVDGALVKSLNVQYASYTLISNSVGWDIV